jgi:hypothetical protein
VRVAPYRRAPGRFQVAVLTPDGLLRHEEGGLYHPDELPGDCRAFGQWDVVRPLMRAGIGEALCWNNEEVKWRRTPQPEEDEWRDRPNDVAVHRVPLHPRLGERVFLRDVIAWRDWLRRSGARAASGTVGGEAMSLLKASLQGQREIDFGRTLNGERRNRPPIRWTRGARIEDGPAGPGLHRGNLVQLDLPSAYSSLLGGLRYGGAWQEVEARGRGFDRWLVEGVEPMYVRAQVQVPELSTGPLLRHRRQRDNYITMHDLALRGPPDPHYPTGCYLAGTWTRAEVMAAMRAGCVVQPLQAWVHRSHRQPFRAWWETILAGREELRGAPGELLVKMTGNALVGQFSRDGGRRSIRGGGRRMRRCASGFQPYPAHDLAEYVTGTTRARLYELVAWAGDRLLTAHTDGAWIRDDGTPYPEGWRVKQRAHRLDLLAPAAYRYWRGRWPCVVMAGAPAIEAEERFAEEWARWLDREEVAA